MATRWCALLMVGGLLAACGSPTDPPGLRESVGWTSVPLGVAQRSDPQVLWTGARWLVVAAVGELVEGPTVVETHGPDGAEVNPLTTYRETFAVWTSPDARTWTRVAEPFADPDDGTRIHPRAAVVALDGGAATSGVTVVGTRMPLPGSMAPGSLTPGGWPMPVALHSPDGGRWSLSPLAEVSGTVDDVAAHPGGLVATGDLRPNGPTTPPYHPAVWTSADGLDWRLTPGVDGAPGEEAWITQVAWGPAGLLATGGVRRPSATEAVRWLSADGADWRELAGAGGPGNLAHVTAVADAYVGLTVEAVGGRYRLVAWRSADGQDWTASTLDAAVAGDGQARLGDAFVGDGAIYVPGVAHVRADPVFCYADLETCDQHQAVVWRSADGGVTWDAVDLGLAPRSGPNLALTGVAAHDGTVVVVGGVDGRLQIWTWHDDGRPPARAPFDLATPEGVPPVAQAGDTIEPGTRYAHPQWVHCGLGPLRLNDVVWVVDVTPPDAPHFSEWPVNNEVVYGTVELVGPDRIDYAAPGLGVLRHYRPVTDDDEMVGCE
jgi:hypothetical protein